MIKLKSTKVIFNFSRGNIIELIFCVLNIFYTIKITSFTKIYLFLINYWAILCIKSYVHDLLLIFIIKEVIKRGMKMVK